MMGTTVSAPIAGTCSRARLLPRASHSSAQRPPAYDESIPPNEMTTAFEYENTRV